MYIIYHYNNICKWIDVNDAMPPILLVFDIFEEYAFLFNKIATSVDSYIFVSCFWNVFSSLGILDFFFGYFKTSVIFMLCANSIIFLIKFDFLLVLFFWGSIILLSIFHSNIFRYSSSLYVRPIVLADYWALDSVCSADSTKAFSRSLLSFTVSALSAYTTIYFDI